MAFGPAAPPDGSRPVMGKPRFTLAQASAAGTTAGAPTPMSMGPPPGSGLPGSGQSQVAPPPTAIAPSANPVVAPHGKAESVGTHHSASPFKRGNPPHGMTKSK